MKHGRGTPCVFFDRDGIVNHPPDDEKRYVLHEDEFHLLPGFTDALRVVLAKGYKAVIVTNQSGVGRGHMTQADLDRIHSKMHALLAAEGLAVHDVIECTSTDDTHPNRKPNPGMLIEAARKHNLDLSRSWMIGDQEKDVIAGRRAGVAKTVKVKGGRAPTDADYHLQSMNELAKFLAEHLPPAAADSRT
ncbi:MAG: HAD family hydrolase [Kiritimatiellae bacterium]|nr:HAD family hydrolase [Kiritimatiellia bacterium]MDW8459019.1 HAD family hydrolase [Verrucomicrobiota bacterium]